MVNKMNDLDIFESSANMNKELCKCGHARDHHNHNSECYYNCFPSGGTGCLCSKFIGTGENEDDMWYFPLDTENWMWPDYPGTFGAVRKFTKHPGLDLYFTVMSELRFLQ